MVPGPGLCWALILYFPEQLFTAPSLPTGPQRADRGSGWLGPHTHMNTDTGQGRVRGGVVGEGTTNQSSSRPGRGVLRTAGSRREGLFPGGLGATGKVGGVQSPPARGLLGAEAVGSWPVLPGAATWPGYAHGRTYGAMRGAGTLHRTQTHTQLQAAVREAGPGRSGSGVGTPQQGHTQATWEQ